MAGNSVECRAIRKVYPDGTEALRDVSLFFPAGKISVLLGASGCGKTTLLRSIAGLSDVTDGTIHIGDADVTRGSPLSRGVAMVFQGSALYPDKTAYKNIEFPLRMARVPRAERRRRVHEAAELLDVTHLLGRRPGELSGGQRQRVGIGRALVRRPGVVLMDEPFSALDAELRTRMRTELLALQREINMTIVYVTHDQAEALSLADRLVVLRDGAVEQAGEPEAVFRKPRTGYVARFLGAMNMLPSGLVSEAVLRERGLTGRDLTIGFRAEDIRPGPPGGPGDIDLGGTPTVTELLGRERLVHFAHKGQPLRARVHADDPVTDPMPLHIRRDHLHFFDTADQRVEPRS
ncbi:ABC transporter ATP-binding protein [Spongiactinospora sp. 9N601]|uniref:ABC transporter ATP-binding protein n=1 Tax=Spongiactinospora sp. 9N601 TaxID=3375149 RepID=UPI0037998CF9